MSHPLDPQPAQRKHADQHSVASAVLTSANDAIMAMDLDGKVLLWNAGCEQLFGWTREEMLGQGITVLVPVERRDELARVLRAVAGIAEAAAIETERLHKSGVTLPVSCWVSPVIDRDGNVLGASAVVRDNSREIELRRQLDEARHLAESRFTQSVIAQATLAPEGVIVEVNPALCRLSGYEPHDLLGRQLTDFMRSDDVDAAAAGLSLVAHGALSEAQHPRLLRHADGRLIETRVSIFPVHDESSAEIVRLEAVFEDISAAAQAHREMRTREARWQSMTQHSGDVALFCDADARLLFVSPSVTSAFGYRPEQLLGGDGWSFVHPDDEAHSRAIWDSVVAGPAGFSETFELRLLAADGTWRWSEQSLTNHLDDPAVEAVVVNVVDVSDRKAAEAVLDELAGTDALTGLPSRAPLMAVLDAAFAGDLASTTAVAVVDVVRMKLINDDYGHRLGDDVLCEVGSRLSAAAGVDRMVARLGGDRFAVLFHELNDVAEVFEACGTILASVDEPFDVGSHLLNVEVSVGAALGPAVESGALLAAAESALTTAKEGVTGSMHVVRAASTSAAVCRARLVEDLRRGLQQDELVVHFQPVVSLSDGRPVAAEALVRWAHPDQGLLSPGAFMDAAEDSGLIVDIGHKVLREACRASARWARFAGGTAPFHVAVNLSAKQLTRGGVVDVVRQALIDTGAAAANLMLEVTESAVMSDVDAAVQTLRQLRELGVAIAVDDFGTGYSSLTYLKRFPLTALKIDRSFVSGLGNDANDGAIVTSVINLARAMQLDCIAEGVETEQQRLILQALGCPYGQGFLWSPALDLATFESWVSVGVRPPRAGGGFDSAAPTHGPRRAAPSQVEGPDAAVVARVAELHASGASLATIAAALNADQHRTSHGRRWTARSVAHLVATA